jgi:GTP-binding protein
MFVDRVTIECHAGGGGDGCLSFRREAHIPRGGPDGGDGGDGGSVIIRAESNLGSLSNIVGHKHWRAEKGNHGEGNLRTGKSGENSVVLVPPGTIVKDFKRGHVLKDLEQDGDTVIVAQGGKGGRGNKRFATSTNRAPREFERGQPGELRTVTLELKLIADVGLIGKPNAGKSTLLSRLSRAHPEIADYPFTTKYPNLGLVRVGYDRQFVVADIPGLIEGAHAGVGLGHEFLRHVERTKILVHLVEPTPMDGSDPIENYHNIRAELELYDESLGNRPEIAVITKCELPDASAAVELLEESLGRSVMQISAVTGQDLPLLIAAILEQLEKLQSEPA